jgi:hypothetical protein
MNGGVTSFRGGTVFVVHLFWHNNSIIYLGEIPRDFTRNIKADRLFYNVSENFASLRSTFGSL